MNKIGLRYSDPKLKKSFSKTNFNDFKEPILDFKDPIFTKIEFLASPKRGIIANFAVSNWANSGQFKIWTKIHQN